MVFRDVDNGADINLRGSGKFVGIGPEVLQKHFSCRMIPPGSKGFERELRVIPDLSFKKMGEGDPGLERNVAL
jgi:hypothetical protein